jgi:oxygen-independent coproporphyrinogen-3 oxidase
MADASILSTSAETAPSTRDAFSEPRAAYIHVPFCAHRCGYCDFTVLAGRDDLATDYLDALERELASLERPHPVETLFIGGGTPSRLAPPLLERLIALVRHWLPLEAGGEWSLEANPIDIAGEAGGEKAAILAAGGVNRVSLGAQSFDAGVLATLERDHSPADVERAVARLTPHIANVALDLIFGVPGQTFASWRTTLARAADSGAVHVSTYGLTIEKGTAFWSRRRKGTLVPAGDELERSMYAAAMDDLERSGFAQYELSNFARAGFACRHNEVYWSGLPYLAFGPGAARYVGGWRQTNHRSTTMWLKRVFAGESPVAETETLDPEARAREALVLGLRRIAGVDFARFREQTGFDAQDLGGRALAQHAAQGLLEITQSNVRLTREGRFLADSVIVDLL